MREFVTIEDREGREGKGREGRREKREGTCYCSLNIFVWFSQFRFSFSFSFSMLNFIFIFDIQFSVFFQSLRNHPYDYIYTIPSPINNSDT